MQPPSEHRKYPSSQSSGQVRASSSLPSLQFLMLLHTHAARMHVPSEQAKLAPQSSPQTLVVSSLPSAQLGLPSHFQDALMHWPSEHREPLPPPQSWVSIQLAYKNHSYFPKETASKTAGKMTSCFEKRPAKPVKTSKNERSFYWPIYRPFF